MANDGPALTEIEITPEMDRAGRDALMEWDSPYCAWADASDSAVVAAIYRAMASRDPARSET